MFKKGDRVQYCNPENAAFHGKYGVIDEHGPRDPTFVKILFDGYSGPHTMLANKTFPDPRLHYPKPRWTDFEEVYDPELDGLGARFRRNAPSSYKRKWETSYTKKVCDSIRGVTMSPGPTPVADVAIELLEQYHRDLHVSYQQRDEARAEVKRLKALVLALEEKLGKVRSLVS